MSDTSYPIFEHYGTNAERLAFTPAPPATGQPIYVWYETDTDNFYIYTTAWKGPFASGGGGTVTNTGTLTNNALVKGNGGVDVSTITTGTGILTALGVNVGTAGSPVINGGALGTPASGVGTNLTGIPVTTGLTQNTGKLLGRTTAGSGATEEISAGVGITLASTTLSAPAGVELDYVEFTSAVSPVETTEGTARVVVTGNSVAYDGSTVVLIEFFAFTARPDSGAAGRRMDFWLYEDGSSIGRLGSMVTPAASADGKPVYLMRRMTPSNASHTYSIRASVSAGTGSIAAGAGTGVGVDMPGFIRITRK